MSLCCPVLTFLGGCLMFFIDFPWGRDFTAENGFLLLLFPNNGGFPLVDLAAVLIGGILPAVLTLRLKIHTEKYLIKRLIIIVVIFAVNRFIRNLLVPGNSDGPHLILYMIFNVGAVLIQVLAVQKEDTLAGERAVLMLSDPIVYWAIYYFIYEMANLVRH